MTDQQQHLKSILDQQQSLAKEVEQLNNQTNVKKEMFFKLQGVVEYLTQLGVTLPQPEPETEPETPVSETEVVKD